MQHIIFSLVLFVIALTTAELQRSPSLLLRKRYRTIRSLGAGVYGSVVLAQDRYSKQLVAIKTQQPHPKHASEFTREPTGYEVEALDKLGDLIAADDGMIVMKYHPGITLKQALDKGFLRSIEQRHAYKGLMQKAMENVHELNISHGDVSMDNVVFRVDRRGRPLEAHFIDFGMSCESENFTEDVSSFRNLWQKVERAAQQQPQKKGPWHRFHQSIRQCFGQRCEVHS